MYDLERQRFGRLQDVNPDRYKKVDLAAARIVSNNDVQFVVQREDGDKGHVVKTARTLEHIWGRCSCDGYQYHDGPCSHLAAVHRADEAGLVTIPTAEPKAVSVEVKSDQQKLADHAAEPDLAADGGRHR